MPPPISADYTSALDKIASDDVEGGKGMQDSIYSTAQAAADKARELKDAAAQAVTGNGSGSSQAEPTAGKVSEQAKSTIQVRCLRHSCACPHYTGTAYS